MAVQKRTNIGITVDAKKDFDRLAKAIKPKGSGNAVSNELVVRALTKLGNNNKKELRALMGA